MFNQWSKAGDEFYGAYVVLSVQSGQRSCSAVTLQAQISLRVWNILHLLRFKRLLQQTRVHDDAHKRSREFEFNMRECVSVSTCGVTEYCTSSDWPLCSLLRVFCLCAAWETSPDCECLMLLLWFKLRVNMEEFYQNISVFYTCPYCPAGFLQTLRSAFWVNVSALVLRNSCCHIVLERRSFLLQPFQPVTFELLTGACRV